MIDGAFRHQDSNGGGGLITNGDTQWMTAGDGILHIEEPPEELVMSGGLFHGFQLWVNLPGRQKMTSPAVPGHPGRAGVAAHLPRRRRAGPGHRRRGRRARGPGHHAHADHPAARDRGARRPAAAAVAALTSTRWPTCWPARAPSGPSSGRCRTGQLAVFGAGDVMTFEAASRPGRAQRGLDILVLGGAADPGAGRRVRAVRDEHPGRAGPGVRGLPGRPAGQHPGRARRAAAGGNHPGHDVL